MLLDEPTVGVDPQSRDRIYDMLAALTTDGVSLLLTTHHLEEAEARCSRTVIIDHGRVIAGGHAAGARRADGRQGPARDAAARRTAEVDDARGCADVAAGAAAAARAASRRVGPALVDDVEVRGPSLQAVFIHLTGRELRE